MSVAPLPARAAWSPAPCAQGAPAPAWHAVSRPATKLSGDFYMLLERPAGWLFALGDVTGHGLEAAVYMLMVQEELERLAGSARPLAGVVGELHDTLLRELPDRRFATLVLAELDGCGGVEVVNAGHCPPLLRRARGAIEALPPSGPLVGALPGTRWRSQRTRLERGDVLLMFSDGVTEAVSPAGEEFGSARVEAVLALGADLHPRALTGLVLGELDAFRGGGPAADDTTVLAVSGG
jgi:serine phosphatase RsbU (regulator of sigma subunit)